MLPRQPGSILALDRLFGADGWSPQADLAIEISEARQRPVGGASAAATVTLQNNELAVECAFGDKELVKLVPGYRWSAPQRRWFLPASPMALDALREYFGEHLAVEEAAATYVELKRRDEQAALQRAQRTVKPAIEAPVTLPEPAGPPLQGGIDGAEDEGIPPTILERLDRLSAAIEELVALLKGSVGIPGAHVELEIPPTEESTNPRSDWRELLGRLEAEPAETRDQANRLAQTGSPESEAPFRAIAGMAMVRLGQHEDALAALRRALERPSVLEEDLAVEATRAYSAAVLALLSAECRPSQPLLQPADFRERLLDELVNDNGFDDGGIGSQEARGRLEYLVNDPVLRRIAPELSDYCRIAHLLGVARGGQWMAANRVTDVLQEKTIGDEGFSMALILLANAVYDQKSVNDWDKAWPREDVQETLPDLGWLVAAAEQRLKAQSVDPAMSEPAALACLACIAGGPAEWASIPQRKTLVQLVPLRHGDRRHYAEFLAAFEPARNGQKSILNLFPGWTKILSQTRLSRSAPYIMDVAANDNGGSKSLTWALAEDVYLPALRLWGISDAQAEIIDLLDLLEGGQRPDNYLNEVGRHVEGEASWTSRVNREQRKTLYRRALEASLRQGHHHDAEEAFDRLVRELQAEGTAARRELVDLAARLSTGMRHMRAPALELLLSLQLEAGEPFEDTAGSLLKFALAESDTRSDEARHELMGLRELYPQLASYLDGQPAAAAIAGATSTANVQGGGKKVLFVGGHEWLRRQVRPILQEQWKLDITWIDGERGPQGPALAETADLVIINLACMGHAASERIMKAAKDAGRPFVAHHSRGVGAVLSIVRECLTDLRTVNGR